MAHDNRTTDRSHRRGSVLILAVISIVVLTTLGMGLTTLGYHVRRNAIQIKTEAAALLAAEAGYERAVFWMGQQQDMLSALESNAQGSTGTLAFSESRCGYAVSLHTFIGSRPVYRIISNGYSGAFSRTVDCLVIQAVSGWDMGKCRIPTGPTTTSPVNFGTGELIDMPLAINKLNDDPDERDIYISGAPTFRQPVAMAESRRSSSGTDKYRTVMPLFTRGIYFDQPQSRILDEPSMAAKISRFRSSTKSQFRYTPVASAAVTNPIPTVQLEFYVDSQDVGKVRVTNNCTVRGFQQSADNRTYDYRITPGSNGERYERYSIYAYHLASAAVPGNGDRATHSLTDTYVSQALGAVQSEPGGQIFVDGNVVIGGDMTNHNGDQLIKGKITVVATGNIWVADSIRLDGAHDLDGTPSASNPNICGLIAQGVIKVVDPGMSDYSYVDNQPVVPRLFSYEPIGVADFANSNSSTRHLRHLPNPVIVEAAMTIGGGGWGAENVQRRAGWTTYGGRKEWPGPVDNLIVRGALVEAIRGVVGIIGADGFNKQYYLDERLIEGILPGDIWLRGKYIPAPAGWKDYRAVAIQVP